MAGVWRATSWLARLRCRVETFCELSPGLSSTVSVRLVWAPSWSSQARHVVHVAELTAQESSELGPLVQRVSAAVTEVMAPEQVYVCLWSHSAGVPGHIHFVVQPAGKEDMVRFDAFGPALQVAMGEAGCFPEVAEIERVCERLREALG